MSDPTLPSNVHVVSSLEPDFDGYRVDADSGRAALTNIEERHFWHLSRNELIAATFRELGVPDGGRVLELGCGTGAVAAFLAQRRYDVTGIDGHLSLVNIAANRAPQASFYVHDMRLPLPVEVGDGFDGAGLFDVIEHLDAPVAAIQSAVARVKPDGVVLGTVPALMALWSRVDEAAGHRTRYNRQSLAAVLDAVHDAETIAIRDFNRHLVPLMWVQRRIVSRSTTNVAMAEANFRMPAAAINSGLILVGRGERFASPVLERTPLPGASLLFALKRRG